VKNKRSFDLSLWQGDGLCLFVLLLACLIYCNRFYGSTFLPESDAMYNLYYRLNDAMVQGGYDPFLFTYSVYRIPLCGLFNPVLLLFSFLLKLPILSLSPMAIALWTCLLTSLCLLWILAASVFLLFKALKCSRPASLLGSIIVSFTGFHLVGVRAFDQFYLVSFACVPPFLWCNLRLTTGRNLLLWSCLSALCIGISVLGGTNVPLFFFVPLVFLMPFLQFLKEKKGPRLMVTWLWQLGSLSVGIVSGAAILWPGMAYLGETNRLNLSSQDDLPSLAIADKITTVFLRDWWTPGTLLYHEQDYFLGLPVVLLALLGSIEWIKNSKQAPKTDVRQLEITLGVAAVASLVLTQLTFLPAFLEKPLSFLFHFASMRHPNRLFLLGLLPVAWLAARGLDRAKSRGLLLGTFGLVSLNLGLIRFRLLPQWEGLLPDTRIAALLSLSAAFLATLVWNFRPFLLVRRERFSAWTLPVVSGLGLLLVYGMYFFAPQQLTMYPAKYLSNPAALANLPESRLEIPSLLGLETNYGELIHYLEHRFTDAPPQFSDPRFRSGRIFSEDASLGEIGGSRFPYYAPHAGYHVAFPLVYDPGSSLALKNLFSKLNESLLDLEGVCFLVGRPRSGGVEMPAKITAPTKMISSIIAQRPSCLPRAFVVPEIVERGDDASALDWVIHAQHDDFLKQAAVNCRKYVCPKLASARNTAAFNPRSVSILEENWKGISLNVGAGNPGFLLLTVPYRAEWQAEINGISTPILAADYAFMALPLGSEGTTVHFKLVERERTRAVWISAVLLISLLVTAGISFRRN
jgi:hypothetical protein